MSAASQDLLEGLHSSLTEHFADMLKNGIESFDKDGNSYRRKPNAAELNVIRQMLKDNGVEALAAPGTALDSIANNLPFPDAGEVPFTAH